MIRLERINEVFVFMAEMAAGRERAVAGRQKDGKTIKKCSDEIKKSVPEINGLCKEI